MTDDRTDDLDGTLQGGGAFDWDAALHNAFADLMFSQTLTPQSDAGTPGDTVHAAFEALMFAAAGDSHGAGGAATTWVANDDGAPEGFGRIMFRRDAEANASQHLPGVLDTASPQINANTVIASGRAANDNAIWIGSGASDHLTGVYGRDPSVAVLDNGDALIAWIGTDDIVHAQFMPGDLHAAGSSDSAERGKLDQLLTGLGDAAAASGGKAGRVTVTAVSQNSFAAVWTSDFALQSVLMGTILTLGTAAHAEDKDDTAATLTWSATDITPVAAPSGVNAIAVAVTDAGALTVTYATEDSSETQTVATSIVHFDTDVTIETVNFVSDDVSHATAQAHTTPLQPVHHQDSGDLGGVTGGAGAAGHAPDNDGSGGHHSSDHAPASAHHFAPITAVADNGNEFTAAFVDGIFTITPQNSDAPVITIPDAIATDPGHPTLDVTPTITGTDTGVAVVYETKTGSGAETVTTVQVAAFDGDSNPVGGGPVTVATATGQDHSFSDVTTGYTHRDPAPAAHSDAEHVGSGATADAGADTTHDAAPDAVAPAVGVLAVAFIADANPDGFGTLNAQFYAVPDDAGHGLVALGEDGQAGGDNDAVFEMGTPDDGGCRAPVIEGLDHGTLAVAWVQQTDHGDGPDVVRGVIMTPGEDMVPEAIDLTGLMPEGVAAGSDPVLTSDDAGDLIVGWIQSVLSGGFEAAAAIFKHTNDGGSHGHWQPPLAATILNHFDELPRDFAIAVSNNGDSLSLTVAWIEADNSVSTAHYDVDTGTVDQPVAINTGGSGPDGGHDSSHGGDPALGLAALPEGQVLVVFASSDDSGTSVTTAIVQAANADVSNTSNHGDSNSGGGDGSNGATGPSVDPIIIAISDDSGSGHDGNNDSSNSGPGGGDDTANIDANAGSGTPAPVQQASLPAGSLAAALARVAPEQAFDFSKNSGGNDGGHCGSDCGHNGSGGSDAPAPVQTADTPASPQVTELPATSLASAIINISGDLIQFVSPVAASDSIYTADGLGDTANGGHESASPAPTSQDVAALEAFAIPVLVNETKGNSSSGSGKSGSDSSGSGNTGNDNSASSLFAGDHSGINDHSSSGSGSGSGDSTSGGSSDSHSGGSANDNTTTTFHDAPLVIAIGFGNDISDYLTPDEQAALVPEPIAVLFEALQFANAFSDAANSDVMLFDSSNVVTISQFKLPDIYNPNHDIPFG